MAPERPHPGDGGNWKSISNERWHELNRAYHEETTGLEVRGIVAIWPPPFNNEE